jgi:hypothetical protein
MAPPPIKRRKGKKKKKGGRKKKKKKVVEWLQYINEVPPYQDPDIVSPTVDLIITLVDNICPLHFEKKVQMKTNKTAKEIRLMIEEMHQGSIGKIKMCREAFVEEDMLKEDKSLHDNGITEEGTYRILYDYEPVSCPLLDF